MENKSIKFELNIEYAPDDREICKILGRIQRQIKLGYLNGGDDRPGLPWYYWGIETVTGPEAVPQILTVYTKHQKPAK